MHWTRRSLLRNPRVGSCFPHARRAAALLVCLCPVWAAHAQQNLPDASQAAPPPIGTTKGLPSNPPTVDPQVMEHLETMRTNERQKQITGDTQKLFLLAQQLRDEVAKNKKDELSVSVLKTSDQIEKLARRVKEEMRGY
jgi:hypothetical protein